MKRTHGKGRIPTILFACIVSLTAVECRAETVPANASVAGDAEKDPFRSLKEGVRKITLSNGMRVIVFRRSQAPVFAGQVWIKVGGVNEIPGLTGISHFLEHMAFKGTETVGTKDFSKEHPLLAELDRLMTQRAEKPADAEREKRLEALTSKLQELWVDNEFSKIYQARGGVGLNAATSKDFTYYTVSLPTSALDLWCWMESERLIRPVFRQFYKEREVVLEERRRSYDDSPDGKMYEALLSAAYWAHPYRLPLIGWPADVRRISPEQVLKLHRRYYRPDNIVISLIGDLDAEQIRPTLETYFGRLRPSADPLDAVGPPEPPQKGGREVEVDFDAEPSLFLAYHKPVYPHKDDLYFSVMHSILAEGRSSIFHRELVQELKLASAVDTTEAPGELFPSLFIVSAVPASGVSLEKLRDAAQGILDRLKIDAVGPAELTAAKKRVKVGLLGSLNSNSGLAGLLGKAELFWNDWRVVFEMYETINQTTADDLKRLAGSYLNVDNRTVVMLKRRDERPPKTVNVRAGHEKQS